MVLAINNFCNYHTPVKALEHIKPFCQEYFSVCDVHLPPVGSVSPGTAPQKDIQTARPQELEMEQALTPSRLSPVLNISS